MSRFVAILALGLWLNLALDACTVPTLDELKAVPPAQRFDVPAPLPCLYGKAVENASGYIIAARYTWYIAPDQQSAWLRQPQALITLAAMPAGTRVELRQSSGGQRFGQGTDLAEFIRSNPCAMNR